MNYHKIYNDIIHSAQLRPDVHLLNGYTETHHILPKSLGGSDESHNLVKLTAREHFVAHWLLWRIHRNLQMAHAFNMMCTTNNNRPRYFNSRGYAIARKAASDSRKGKQTSAVTRVRISNAMKGIKRSNETRKKMSIASKQRGNNKLGIRHNEETKRKISDTLKGKKRGPYKKWTQKTKYI